MLDAIACFTLLLACSAGDFWHPSALASARAPSHFRRPLLSGAISGIKSLGAGLLYHTMRFAGHEEQFSVDKVDRRLEDVNWGRPR